MLDQIEGSIGTSSLGLILSEQRRIRPLALAGVEPSAAALASGQYPLSKTLYFVLPAQPHAQALAFVDYVFEQGADYLRATGHLLHARPD